MPITGPWENPRPETIWNAVAAFQHDYREEAVKKGYSYFCRRCRLDQLLREITKLLGTPPDCPEKVPFVRSSEP